MAIQQEQSTAKDSAPAHPVARRYSPPGGRIGALLTLSIPLALLILGWSLRGLPNPPVPQTRPGQLPTAHREIRAALPPHGAFDRTVEPGRNRLLDGDNGGADTSTTSVALPNSATVRRSEEPARLSGMSARRAGVSADTLYVEGGRTVQRWETNVPAALDTRTDRAVVALGNRGGAIDASEGGTSLVSNARYDPVANRWDTPPPLPTPRDGLAAVTLDGKIYAVSGREASMPSIVVEVFDPLIGMWSGGTPPLAPLADLVAVASASRIHAVRGEIPRVYDASLDRCIGGVMPPIPCLGVGPAAVSDSLYALGNGQPAISAALGSVDVLVTGPAPETVLPKATGIDRGGAIAVVAGLLLTVTMMGIVLRVGHRRATRDEETPALEDKGPTVERDTDAGGAEADAAPTGR